MARAYGTNSSLRRERKQQTQDRLVQAATEVFREKGLAGGTIDDIATRAGVSRQTFYFHFESKEQLLLRIRRIEEERMLVCYRELAALVSPDRDACARWAEQFIRFAREDEATILLLMRTVPFEMVEGGHATSYYDEVIAMIAERQSAFRSARADGDPLRHAQALLLFFQLEMMLRYCLVETGLDTGSICAAWGLQWSEFIAAGEK